MNLEELQSSSFVGPSHRIPASSPITAPNEGAQHPPKASSLSSTPSDSAWVSPFTTLPPLPAFRRTGAHSLTSPEQIRSRDSSGAYYAAAWGSPYASPSPKHRASSHRTGRRSIDLDSSFIRAKGVSQRLNKHYSIDSSDIASPEARRDLTGAHPLPEHDSERSHWLSDSEGSVVGDYNEDGQYTPRKGGDLHSWGASPAPAVARLGHLATESVDTVTPDSFRNGLSWHSSRPDRTASSADMALVEEGEPGPALESPSLEQKPLPSVPLEQAQVTGEGHKKEEPVSPTRPRPGTMPSYQRLKKKVNWNGKTCVIALPLTDRESSDLPPVLTAQEVRDRIVALKAEGHTTKGFELTDFIEDSSGIGSGHSRPVYPDPQEIHSEHQKRNFLVSIPNQEEWNQWVDWLQEEKLRALGVTPSSSEPPASVASPFSASLSRTSSRYPGLVTSPPIGTSSAASNPLRATSNPFSPAFSPSSGVGSQLGSGASSQYNAFHAPGHAYKQSTAFLPGQGRGQSPRDFSPPQLNQLSPPAVRSPVDGFGRRPTGFSPINPQGMQSLGEVLSPVSNPTSAAPSPNIVANMTEYMPVTRDPQQPRSASHEPVPPSLSRPTMPQMSSSLPRTPNIEHLSRPAIEIQHPTPRSHRHNLSAALQKEIDEAEAALESQREDSIELTKDEVARAMSKRDETIAEELQAELPILKRPETIEDDKSDIETNPSIAASPLLIDDKNPFASWQGLSDAARGETKRAPLAPRQSYKSHTAQPSLSKFNVEAKEFNPSGAFDGSNFIATDFNPFAAPARAPMSLVRANETKQQESASQLKADAPAFNPGAATFEPSFTAPKPADTQSPSSFKIPSSTFNVEAPEFNPNISPSKIFKSAQDSTSESEPRHASIFGKVTIDPTTKVTRRTSKALQIVRPASKDGDSGSESPAYSSLEEEDDGGRPVAPTERAKRARRASSDGDRSPVFADSAPFNHNHTRILSEIVDEGEGDEPLEKTKEKPVDGWAYIPAEPDSLNFKPPSPSGNASVEMSAVTSPYTFTNEDDAVRFSEARPRSNSGSEIETGTQEDEKQDSEPVSAALSSPLKQGASTDMSPPSSSALAQPFALQPKQIPESGSQRDIIPPKPGKVTGLGASRWAVTPSPTSSPPIAHAAPVQSSDHDELPVKQEYESEQSNIKVSGSLDESIKSPASTKNQDRLEDSRIGDTPEFGLEQSLEHTRPQADDSVPSFEEIDAVMKHLDRNPELGIERDASPVHSTPLVDMRLGTNLRSDAPSPSPRRRSDQHSIHADAASSAAYGLGIGIHRLEAGKEEISDWNDALSTDEEEKLESRAQFFDGRVNGMVDGILENRLGPLERTLQTIQHSIALMANRPHGKSSRRSLSTDAKESDADDEDDYDAYEGFQSYRSRSPEAKRDTRRASRIRAAVAEGLTAYRESIAPQEPQADLSQILGELAQMREELKQSRAAPQQAAQQSSLQDLRATLDEVIQNHPRLRGSRVQQDHEPSESKYKIHVEGLNAMLKAEQERAEHETKLRKKADEEIELLKRALSEAETEAAEHREASDAAQQSLGAFVKEKDAYRQLEEDLHLLNRKNEELEMNLDEYRKYKVELQDDIDEEREKSIELKRLLHDFKDRFEERTDTCKVLRSRVEKLQEQISVAVRDLTSEQSQWRSRESELLTKMSIIENALDQAARQREKVEVDYNELGKQYKEDYNDIAKQYKDALLYKDRFDNLKDELAKSHEMIAGLQNESRHHQDTSFRLQKELDHISNNKDAEVATAAAKLTAELEGARSQLESYRADSEARVARLQARLDSAELDLEEQKAKHDTVVAETAEMHTRAIQEATEKAEMSLETQQAAHQSHLSDLRDRHTRAMHNSSDDKHRLEYQFNEKLSMSEDKVRHLEGKLIDIEERLEITKSAARAAIEAATAKGVNLPTPASSVVASPPQRATSASLSLVKGTELPEKIPVQSLRESILVLQDQLQQRELRIEKLEAELAQVDKEMPNKLKERDTEVTWLRELLAVRVDDIEDIIATVASPSFNREAVKDAAVRLKANIQMEQQIRERAAQGAGAITNFQMQLPTISSLAAYAQSPRQALPLAAAAAWGNFRKVRDIGGEKINEYLTQNTLATPSKNSNGMGSPSSLMSGIMTPPNTGVRTPSVERDDRPPSMRPLAAAAAARKAHSGFPGATGAGPAVDVQPRPLRGYSSKPRALGARREVVVEQDEPLGGGNLKSPTSPTPQPRPQTPPMQSSATENNDDLMGDVDEDASPLGGRGVGDGDGD